ncbi:MAG: 2-phospho-L-lactate guanylyltransferase [Natronomonas sp.]
MDVLVPFAADDPKTRLSEVLSAAERKQFSRSMLEDVLDGLWAVDADPTVLSTAPIDIDGDAAVVVDDRSLSEAVNDRLDPPQAVVVADLPLATAETFRRLFDSAVDADVAVAPGLGGGTNCLVVDHPEFRVDYHGASIRDHRTIADEVGADLTAIDSFRLAVDIDTPADLSEVLLHAEGRTREFLEAAGFELTIRDGRVSVAR